MRPKDAGSLHCLEQGAASLHVLFDVQNLQPTFANPPLRAQITLEHKDKQCRQIEYVKGAQLACSV